VDFGHAIAALIAGKKVGRAGWNGKNMFLVYVPGTPNAPITAGTPYAAALKGHASITIDPHIDMFTAKGTMQPGWLASQADILATDWETIS